MRDAVGAAPSSAPSFELQLHCVNEVLFLFVSKPASNAGSECDNSLSSSSAFYSDPVSCG